MQVNKSAIKEFFQILHGSGNFDGDQGLFTHDKRTFWVPASNIDDVVEKAAALAENYETRFNTSLHNERHVKEEYLRRHPERDDRYARGTEATAEVSFGAFLDIDVLGPGHVESNLPASKKIAIEFLQNLPLRVAIIIDSGGGIHSYILFDKPFFIVNDMERQRIKRLLSGIQKMVRDAGQEQGWNLDDVGNLSQMGRIPGTWNCKVPNNPCEVKMIYSNKDNRYSVEELEDKIIKKPEPRVYQEYKEEEQENLPELKLIYERCEWFRHTIDDAEILTEPEWFGQIGISSRCLNGREESHRISEPYTKYSYTETETKIDHALNDGGPRTCTNISELTANRYCRGCHLKNCITSPIQLGYQQMDQNFKEQNIVSEVYIQKAEKIINIIRAGDKGAHMNPDAISTFASLALADPAEYTRKYSELKDCKVQVQSFKKSVDAEKRRQKAESRHGNNKIHLLNQFLEDSPLPEAIIPLEYEVSINGVEKVRYQENGDVFRQKIALKPVIISKRFRDIDNGWEQIELSWKTEKWHSLIVERSVIANSRKIIELADVGIPVHTVNSNEMVVYLAEFEALNYDILPCESITSHLGWQGLGGKYGFLIGDELYTDDEGHESLDIKFKADAVGDSQIAKAFRKEGEFLAWQDTIKEIKGYPAVMASLYASFSAVLLEILGCSNFVYEMACRTSKGKTTSLRIAGSVWGCPDERSQNSTLHSWNNTKVYMERISSIYNGLPLLLDDTQQSKSSEFTSDIIYMVCNGRGRGRGTTKGIAYTKPIKTVLISTGEVPSIHMTNHGGTRGRVLEITKKPFSARHMFLDLDNGEAVISINQRIKSNFGHAGPMFVEYVLSNKNQWVDWKKSFREMEAEYAKKSNGSEVGGRLAEYAAMICTAGRLVHEAQILPWEFEDPMETLWPVVTNESVDPNGEVTCLNHVFSWAAANKENFAIDRDKRTCPHGGWLGKWNFENDLDDIAIIPNVLQKVIKEAGFEVESILRGWLDRGWLAVNANDKNHRYLKQVKMQNVNVRMIVIKRSVIKAFEDQNDES